MEERKYNRSWYVVFTPSNNVRWWNWMLDKDIHHCFLVTAGAEGSIVINTSVGGTKLQTYKESAERIVINCLTKGFKVVEYKTGNIIKPRMKFFRSCIGVAKDYLGVNDLRIITAKQLYEYIK